MLIIFTSHRVELLPLLSRCIEDYKCLVLEEPETEELKQLLAGKMSAKEYAMWMDTPFPAYTEKLAEVLLKIRKRKKVLAVEPYLQVIEGIHKAVEEGRYEEYVKDGVVKRVLEVERKATKALLDYQEAFMSKDFDLIVENTVRFARADAERFVLRDRMRAERIVEVVELSGVPDNEFAIEAGQIHFLLESFLRETLEKSIGSLNLVEVAAREAGIKYVKNPGNELTEYYIKEIVGLNFKERKDCELLAAQALVYITIVKKEEMLPTESCKYPHILDEVRAAKIARSLGYEGCRRFVERVWFREK